MTDGFSGITTKYAYDSIKRLTSMITSTGFRLSLSYDDKNRVSKINESISGTGITDKQTEYNYSSTGIIEQVKTTQNNTALTTTYQFDDLYRMHISSLKLKAGETEQEVLRNTYQYREGELAGSTTNYVKQHIINDRTFDYTYDVRGNITQISLNGNVVATYTYDEYDQLISETKNGVTTTWTYDAGGNILTKSHGDTIIEYTYGDAEWRDKLSSYNGKSITYDEIGNPLTIGTDTTLTLEAGRRLASITKADITTSFIYNADGYRTSKTSGGVTTTYHLDGSRITAMIKGTDELSFAYDENGAVIGLYHNGTAYAYAKNLQGDIIGIIDGNGIWVVTYEYDAWGNPITTEGTMKDTLGSLNPFRYRGYVYDVETGLYYVSSRYYDAEIGRFLNADGEMEGIGGETLGYNLFAYCFNNPINMSDPTGNWPKWVTGVLNVVSGVAQMAVGATLGATLGWTGAGAVVAGFLIANGAGTATKGVTQIINDIADKKIIREENPAKKVVEDVGGFIGGDKGKKLASTAYDGATIASNIYAGATVLNANMPKILNSPVFTQNNGYGIKLGKNIEMLYRNPNAAGGMGGTFFSYKGTLGKFRIDWDPAHGFHSHPPGH